MKTNYIIIGLQVVVIVLGMRMLTSKNTSTQKEWGLCEGKLLVMEKYEAYYMPDTSQILRDATPVNHNRHANIPEGYNYQGE